ncbi:tail fiber assembly protein [Providencia rettgeri]
MIYYKNNNNDVYAYLKSDLAQVGRITDLEHLLSDKEPAYIAASNNLTQAVTALEQAQASFNDAMTKVDLEEDGESHSEQHSKEIEKLASLVAQKENEHEEALNSFNNEKAVYQQLKDEYDEILPVFFDIRENLKSLKKMTIKEIDAHLNPPISKEQLIAEAEMQKQLCADDAEKNITMLERKVKLNMATDDDKNSLTAWEVYSIKVSDIDTSTEPDIEWPVKP